MLVISGVLSPLLVITVYQQEQYHKDNAAVIPKCRKFSRVFQIPLLAIIVQQYLIYNQVYHLQIEVMATSSKTANISDISENKSCTEAVQLREETWKPLMGEIQSLVYTLCELDDDKTKSLDIIAEHTERIKNAIPSKPIDIWYPKPIHHLLSVHPLQRIEIPLDVLEVLVSLGFDVNEGYHNSDRIRKDVDYYGNVDENEKDISNGNSDSKDVDNYNFKKYIPNKVKMTCFHFAVKNCHYNAARWLLQHGADPDKESYMHAFDEHDEYMSDEIPNPSLKTIPLISVLAAQKDAPIDLLDLLITPENINGNPQRKTDLPLHIAAENGHVNIALLLIERGADVNQDDADGDLPLHLAVRKGHSDLALLLIKHGASVNQEDRLGNPPLDHAMREGHTDLALSLIKHGASVNQEDRLEDPPLHRAVKGGHFDLALSMISHGASVNQKDRYGSLALYFAVRKLHTDLALSMIRHGASVNQKDGFGDPALHLASREGHTDLALLLIKHGSSTNKEDRRGDLPLHLAVMKGCTDLALPLIKHGTSVNQENRRGDLPLHLAVIKGYTDLAISLIKHGASVNRRDRDGKLAIAYYFNKDKKQFNDELFTMLIPGSYMDILDIICNMVENMTKRNPKLLSWRLLQLIQHLIVMQPLNFAISVRHVWCDIYATNVELNNKVLTCGAFTSGEDSFKTAYLYSVLLVLLDCAVSFPNAIVPQLSAAPTAEDLRSAQSIDDLWHMYKHKDKVKRLQTLCIHKTRQFMVSLTDGSFQSLPVPNCVHKLLMLHDVADVFCEACKLWPKCIPMEDLTRLSSTIY